MAIIQPTPDHVLDEATRAALRNVNTTAVVDVLARNGYDARYTYLSNIRTMNPGLRLVLRLPHAPSRLAISAGHVFRPATAVRPAGSALYNRAQRHGGHSR